MLTKTNDYPITGKRNFTEELEFSASKSSGPGGQNVNKVNTKVELRFHIFSSKLLTDNEKELLLKKLRNRINEDGYLIITSQTERSQMKNRINAMHKFYELINNELKKKKKRKPTMPTPASNEKRLIRKKNRSEIKALRKKL